jgi:hypothetical protein
MRRRAPHLKGFYRSRPSSGSSAARVPVIDRVCALLSHARAASPRARNACGPYQQRGLPPPTAGPCDRGTQALDARPEPPGRAAAAPAPPRCRPWPRCRRRRGWRGYRWMKRGRGCERSWPGTSHRRTAPLPRRRCAAPFSEGACYKGGHATPSRGRPARCAAAGLRSGPQRPAAGGARSRAQRGPSLARAVPAPAAAARQGGGKQEATLRRQGGGKAQTEPSPSAPTAHHTCRCYGMRSPPSPPLGRLGSRPPAPPPRQRLRPPAHRRCRRLLRPRWAPGRAAGRGARSRLWTT